MITLGDYLEIGGEEAVIGRTFSSGGNTPLLFRIKEFYYDASNVRRARGDKEQDGRFTYFGDLGSVEQLVRTREISFRQDYIWVF